MDSLLVENFDEDTELPEGASSDRQTTHSLIFTPNSSQQLPPFIRPPSIPDSGYFGFLTSQGVFDLPPISLQCKLVQAFVEIVYPRMPLLSLEYLLTCLSSPDGSHGQVSLMLYTGVLYASSIHVGIDVIRGHGYLDRRSLKKMLYKHTEVSDEVKLPCSF